MTEFEKLTKNQFFVIDSENLNTVKSRLYGFAVHEGEFVQNQDLKKDLNLAGGRGTFVYVKVDSNKITIEQDYNGCYGLFLFRDGDYFAISNSFWKLVEHVGNAHSLSLNYDYANSFIQVNLASLAYRDTLANEIEMLPRNLFVSIDISSKKLTTNRLCFEEHVVDINSKKAFEILDNWFYLWTDLIRSIKSKTNNISTDLSGGFDSRLVFALFLGAGIDMNQVTINSINDTKHTHADDYEIASAIAKHFGVKLNAGDIRSSKKAFKDLRTVINLSFYTKLGFHKQMYYKYNYYEKPIFAFTGCGSVKNYPNKTASEYKNAIVMRAGGYDPLMKKSTETLVDSLYSQFTEYYKVEDPDSKELPRHQYYDIRCRNHFGKSTVEAYMSNAFDFTPLIDPELRKIKFSDSKCDDSMLLYSIMLARYCPDLLEFKFDSGRFIEKSTIEYAKKINEKYPFKLKKREIVSYLNTDSDETETSDLSDGDCEDFVLKAFKSKAFRGMFAQCFPLRVYDKVLCGIPKQNFHPLMDAYACISAVRMLAQMQGQNSIKDNDLYSWLQTFEKYPDYEESFVHFSQMDMLKKYVTARIDIKNFGTSTNSVELLSGADKLSYCEKPAWFKNEKGEGLVTQSFAGDVDLELKCVGSGDLRISLMGIDFRDKNGVRFPIWIDYNKIMVNGKNLIETPTVVCLEKPIIKYLKVTDGQIVKIHAEWKPFDKTSVMI